MPRQRPPPRPRASLRPYKSRPQRRDQIVRATLAILAEQGLHAWTTSTLARRVGVSEATLFRHFASKEEILSEALRSQARALKQQIEGYEAAGSPWERIEGLILHVLSFMEASGGAPLIILSGQAAGISAAERRRVRETIALLRGRLTEFFGEAIAESPRTAHLDPEAAADLALAVGQSTALRWMISGRRLPLLETASAMFAALRRGLAAEAGEGSSRSSPARR